MILAYSLYDYTFTAERNIFCILFRLRFSICKWYLSAVNKKKLSNSFNLEKITFPRCNARGNGQYVSGEGEGGDIAKMFINHVTMQHKISGRYQETIFQTERVT